MGERALRVTGLGKRYRLGNSLSASGHTAEALRRLLSRTPRPTEANDTLWALKDVSFDVETGEVLGVIGRNGAGKSTLLRLLARITEPTEGRAEVRGRVAALLEVGTGFHAELTARENIYLNGALLGMRKREIERKFDDIVQFSGVERFLDTPVKRFSSGMYMRLGFAVAAHLEPDILIVDEVLAVGDLEFQKKCLGKMREVTQSGRTVLLVSHNMATIKGLADRAIQLEGGRLVADGAPGEVIDHFLRGMDSVRSGEIPDETERGGTREALVRRIELLDRSGRRRTQLYYGEPFQVVMTVEVKKPVTDAVFEVGICGFDGTRGTTSFSTDRGGTIEKLGPGMHRIQLDLDVDLIPDQYAFDLGVHHAGPPWTMDYLQRVFPFEVLNVGVDGGDRYPFDVVRGFVRPAAAWSRAGQDRSTGSGEHVPQMAADP